MKKSFVDVQKEIKTNADLILKKYKDAGIDVENYVYRTYHQFLSKQHERKYPFAEKNCMNFTDTLSVMQSHRRFIITNIAEFTTQYRISYIVEAELEAAYNDIEQIPAIEV